MQLLPVSPAQGPALSPRNQTFVARGGGAQSPVPAAPGKGDLVKDAFMAGWSFFERGWGAPPCTPWAPLFQPWGAFTFVQGTIWPGACPDIPVGQSEQTFQTCN